MKTFYGDSHRKLQDEFDSRKMADRLDDLIVKNEFDEDAINFIKSRDMFFLSTIDHNDSPTVSYKGGDPGFVSIVDTKTLLFPSYDGNGMFMSMGNIKQNCKVGMLFICFEKPHRLRVHGNASILDIKTESLKKKYPEADLIVQIKLTNYWQNCPRYIHRYKKMSRSKYVPRKGTKTPMAGWKKTDVVQDALSEKDKKVINKSDIIGIGEWTDKVKSGDPTA